jgi:hypothetical protein
MKRHSKRWKTMERTRGERDCQQSVWACTSISITENIYYSQLSSVAILLPPEPVSHSIMQGKDCVLSPSVLSSCGLPLPPTCLLLTVNEARSYFVSTILRWSVVHLDLDSLDQVWTLCCVTFKNGQTSTCNKNLTLCPELHRYRSVSWEMTGNVNMKRHVCKANKETDRH